MGKPRTTRPSPRTHTSPSPDKIMALFGLRDALYHADSSGLLLALFDDTTDLDSIPLSKLREAVKEGLAQLAAYAAERR